MPLNRLYSHFCYFPLDFEKMREAAAYFLGEHDFKSFCALRSQAEETVRTIYSLDLTKDGDLITMRITGSGFLYNMVRIIAGTLMRVGTGAYPPAHVEEIMDARDRSVAGPKASAKGLTLVELQFEREPEPFVGGENKFWKYCLDQTGMVRLGKSYLTVERCVDQELPGLLKRVIHQAVRNGASKVYVRDCENRLSAGDCYGFYQLRLVVGSSEDGDAWFMTDRCGYPGTGGQDE